MILGIDLGTTNSAVGVWRDGRAELIPNSLGHLLTPSAVSMGDDGAVIVGLPARERQVSHPEQTATAFKRYMGTSRSISLGKRKFLPEELSALVLRALKADAEAHLGQSVTDAIITVPAYFNDKQRKATRRAGELAGLNVERLIKEPTAAALAYGIHELAGDSKFLVFDLGGGTFDVSIVEIFDGIIEVRASTGDNRLGGEDFNELLVDAMFRQCRAQLGITERPQTGVLYERMRAQAERARRALSSNDRAELRVLHDERAIDYAIATDEFEKLAEPLLQRLRDPVLRALKDGDIHADELNSIVLVGGATRMPIVRRTVTKMFGRFPEARLNPDEAVALGAAVQAGLKARDAALKEVVLTDVCPYSLGVEIAERVAGAGLRPGIFAPIIERNTVVPASREKVFTTLFDGQSVVEIEVFQGEARLVRDNIHLGKLSVPTPRRAAGEVEVECRFSYDISGLLEVDVHVPATGERRQLVIADDEQSMSAADLQVRRTQLASLKVHPRDQDANRAALARAERCYEQSLGDIRGRIGQWIAQFESVLERQDPREIAASLTAFLKALDTVDGKTFL